MSSSPSKRKKKSRFKIPWIDWFIIRGLELRSLDRKIEVLEEGFRNQHQRILLEGKITARFLHEISFMKGRLKAPQCPKCGKPKTAGGIQWLDHPLGCEKQKLKKEGDRT